MGWIKQLTMPKAEKEHWAEITDHGYWWGEHKTAKNAINEFYNTTKKNILPRISYDYQDTLLYDNLLNGHEALEFATDVLAAATVGYLQDFYHDLKEIVVYGDHRVLSHTSDFYSSSKYVLYNAMPVYIGLLDRMSRDVKEYSFVDLVRLVHAKTKKFALMGNKVYSVADNPKLTDYCNGDYHIPTAEETFSFLWQVDLRVALCDNHYYFHTANGLSFRLTSINKNSYDNVNKRLYNRGASAKSILGINANQVFPSLEAVSRSFLSGYISESLASDIYYDEMTWIIGKIEQNPLLYFNMRNSSQKADVLDIHNIDITTGYYYPDVLEDPYVKELREYHHKRALNAACVYFVANKYIKAHPGVKLNAMAKRILILMARRMEAVRHLNINITFDDEVITSMDYADYMYDKLDEWGITPEDFIRNDECPLNDGRLSLDHLGEELGLSNAVRADGTPYLSIATKEERIALHMATVEAAFTDATAEAHMEGRKDAFPYNVEESAFEESNSDTLSSENNENTENKESSDSKENMYDKTIKTFYKGMRRLHPDDFEEVAQSMTKLIKLDDYVASKITPDEIKAAKTYNKYKNLKHTYTEEEFKKLCNELVEKGELNEGKAFELKYDIFTMLPPKKKVDSNANS